MYGVGSVLPARRPAPPEFPGPGLSAAPGCARDGSRMISGVVSSPTKSEVEGLFLALPLSRAAEFCGVIFQSGKQER